MASGRKHSSLRSFDACTEENESEECDLVNLSKEITDALISYEKVAAPAFGTTTTIEATGKHTPLDDKQSTHTGCDSFFDPEQNFHLELLSVQSAGVRTETTVQVHSDNIQENDQAHVRARVSPWTQRSSFQAVRHGLGAVLRRASGSSSRISNPSSDPLHTPSVAFTRGNSKEYSIDETASFRNFLDHSFEPDILEEPIDGVVTSLPELERVPTRLERLAQREAAKAARKAERTLRKTASAGNLSQRHEGREQRPSHRVQKEFHGFMGSDFVF